MCNADRLSVFLRLEWRFVSLSTVRGWRQCSLYRASYAEWGMLLLHFHVSVMSFQTRSTFFTSSILALDQIRLSIRGLRVEKKTWHGKKDEVTWNVRVVAEGA